MTPYSKLFQYLDIDNWKWLEAICQVESSGNPNAVGDDGRAVGLFQLWESFWTDWGPPDYSPDHRAHPLCAATAVLAFWWANDSHGPRDRLLIFHYGRSRWLGLRGTDPDSYIARIMRVYGTL